MNSVWWFYRKILRLNLSLLDHQGKPLYKMGFLASTTTTPWLPLLSGDKAHDHQREPINDTHDCCIFGKLPDSSRPWHNRGHNLLRSSVGWIILEANLWWPVRWYLLEPKLTSLIVKCTLLNGSWFSIKYLAPGQWNTPNSNIFIGPLALTDTDWLNRSHCSDLTDLTLASEDVNSKLVFVVFVADHLMLKLKKVV